MREAACHRKETRNLTQAKLLKQKGDSSNKGDALSILREEETDYGDREMEQVLCSL